MRNKIINIIISTLILFIISCSDSFLDINPEQNVAAENAVVDLNTFQTATNGVYSLLQDNGYYGSNLYIIPELMADNLYLSFKSTVRYLDFNNFVVSKENSRAKDAWNAIYKVAVNATRAIVGGEKILEEFPGQETQIKQLLGEVYALRALAHFDLVRLFAQPYNYTNDATHPGIPLITEVNEKEISLSRDPVNEVYKSINSDLNKAIEYMIEEKQEGRFSMYAAIALAARVALYEDENEKAIRYSTEVIESEIFSLIPNEDYFDLWTNDFNQETLMEVVNTKSDNAGTTGLGYFFDVDGYADALVTKSLFSAYNEEDVRLQTILEGSKPNAEDHAYFVNKFPRGVLLDDNVKILRLAEQYLIRAEAYVKTNQYELAQRDLNEVIKRSESNARRITETGEALLNRILLERRKELAFEGHRLFDLNRNKQGVEIDRGNDDIIHATYPNNRFILPIPLDEINSNSEIQFQQNPGY